MPCNAPSAPGTKQAHSTCADMQGEAGRACPHCTAVSRGHPDGAQARADAAARPDSHPPLPPRSGGRAHLPRARRRAAQVCGRARAARRAVPTPAPISRTGGVRDYTTPAGAAAPRTPSRPPLRAAPAWPRGRPRPCARPPRCSPAAPPAPPRRTPPPPPAAAQPRPFSAFGRERRCARGRRLPAAPRPPALRLSVGCLRRRPPPPPHKGHRGFSH